jgi:SAM-dependent methyltransferase
MTSPGELWRIALDLVRDGDVVLDIGAGRGEFTDAALHRGAIVIAVDASTHRCDLLRASHAQLRLRVLNTAVVSTIDHRLRFVERGNVRRVVRTAADDGEAVEQTSIADLVSQFSPRLVRFRAVGHESALVGLTIPAVLVESDAIATNFPWPAHVAETSDGLRNVAEAQPILPSRHQGLYGSIVSTDGIKLASDDDITRWAADESFAREPLRRVRLARNLEQFGPLTSELVRVADRLALDPSDEVLDAMAWHRAVPMPPSERIARRLVAFDSLVTHIATARDGVERPAPLSLPQ